MTTIKSYTDLNQSKKLAEILPLESADMFFADLLVNRKHKYLVNLLETYSFKTFKDTETHKSKRLGFIPCWSLSVLLDVLPLEIDTHKQTDGDKIYYYVECMKKEIYLSTERYENLIDACYEMIVKLHKLKML